MPYKLSISMLRSFWLSNRLVPSQKISTSDGNVNFKALNIKSSFASGDYSNLTCYN